MIQELWIIYGIHFNQIGDNQMVCLTAIVHTTNRWNVLTQANMNVNFISLQDHNLLENDVV